MAQKTPKDELNAQKSMTRKILSQFDFNPLSNPALITATLGFAFGTAAAWFLDETKLSPEELERFNAAIERSNNWEPIEVHIGPPPPPSKKPDRPPFTNGTAPQ